MKRIAKATGIFLLLIVIATVVCASYIKWALPNVGKPPDMKIDATPERITRGEYLAKHVAGCTGCHSVHNDTLYDGPVFASNFAAGGELYDESMGYPGTFYSKNLTPYHLGNWTDGEIFRAITCGVSKDGKALFNAMPYNVFGTLDSDDMVSIVAYLRTLPSIKKDVAPAQFDFPTDILINTMPAKARFTKKPDTADHVAYGKYLVTMAGCSGCHTPYQGNKPIPGADFAGNQHFTLGKYIVSSGNLTPDEETGIGSWTKEAFINRFKSFSDTNYHPAHVGPNDPNTVMPWLEYTGLTPADLGDIYEYLRTLPPVKDKVVKFRKG
jgi:mono/diheme cytochrome c family protein